MANPIPKHSSCGEKTKINLSGVGKKKFKETYFVCKKQRHICKDCCHVKGKKHAQSNIFENVNEKATCCS